MAKTEKIKLPKTKHNRLSAASALVGAVTAFSLWTARSAIKSIGMRARERARQRAIDAVEEDPRALIILNPGRYAYTLMSLVTDERVNKSDRRIRLLGESKDRYISGPLYFDFRLSHLRHEWMPDGFVIGHLMDK